MNDQIKAPLSLQPLRERIAERIQASAEGAISFRAYMEYCLYEPEIGYYMRPTPKVGREGDYYTSPFLGDVLGEILARYASRLVRRQGNGADKLRLVEWGAGTGRLASHLLQHMQRLYPSVYETLEYVAVEQSPYHRSLIKESLKQHAGKLQFALPQEELYHDDATLLVLSNELLDAFPVHRIRMREDGLKEIGVGWDAEKQSFYEIETPCREPRLFNYLEEERIQLQAGQAAEVNLEAMDWIEAQLNRMPRGTLLTIDYGDLAEELYAPHRMEGTLLCYRQHRASDAPYEYVGEQDITSHIDFSACIRSGLKAGVTDYTYGTQKRFLLDQGLLDMLQEHQSFDPFSPAAKRNRAIRQLLLSDQMSELFKVLEQRKER